MLLLLKLSLSPLLVALVTLAGRRWGNRASGVLTSLPVSTGPVLLFFAIEQGEGFAANASVAALAGLASSAAFFLAYAWVATRRGWVAALLLATLTYALLTALLMGIPLGAESALLLALASFALAHWLLPRQQAQTLAGVAIAVAVARFDLPLRMLAAMTLTLVLTGLAQLLGPQLSGLLTPFPVATSVLASFILAQQGKAGAIAFMRALTGTMYGFCLFCYVLALAFEPLGIAAAFALALSLQLVFNALIYLASRRFASYRAERAPGIKRRKPA